jgi:hypothetical protein
MKMMLLGAPLNEVQTTITPPIRSIAEAVERKNMRFVPIKTTISWTCWRSIGFETS